jgi:hypothetical protein
MFLKLFGCTVVLLHNILEQVDLESAGFTKNKLVSKIYNLIGKIQQNAYLKQMLLTISKYVDVLGEKYKSENVSLIPQFFEKRKRLI